MANVRDFEYIVEIAQYGSVSKAAQALYLSQPTLTKFLQRVEREVGQPLFHRVGKRFVLTPAGEIYVSKAKSILRLNHELEQELTDLAAMRSGSIRLGTTAGRSGYVARVVAPLFYREYPDVRLLLTIAHTDQLLKMIQNNELDIVLSNCDQEFDALQAQPLAEDEMVLVVPTHSPLIAKAQAVEGFRFPVIQAKDWCREDFVLPSAISHSYRLAMDYFRELNITPRVVMELQDLRAVMDAVEAGVGISMFVSFPYRSGRTLRYLSLGRKDAPRQQVFVITRQGAYYNKAQQRLMELLEETYCSAELERGLEEAARQEPANV